MNAAYDYDDAQQYILNVSFTDGLADTDGGIFMFYVTRNSPPSFTNLGSKCTSNIYSSSRLNLSIACTSCTICLAVSLMSLSMTHFLCVCISESICASRPTLTSFAPVRLSPLSIYPLFRICSYIPVYPI